MSLDEKITPETTTETDFIHTTNFTLSINHPGGKCILIFTK
jgi:hypothetical protein